MTRTRPATGRRPGPPSKERVQFYMARAPEVKAVFQDENSVLLEEGIVWELLIKSGIIDHLRDFLRQRKTTWLDQGIASPETEYEDMLAELREQAKAGNTQAAKLWLEETQGDVSADAFNVNVSITDYRIADSSLKHIVSKAHQDTVIEILSGLDERLLIDEAPYDLRTSLRQFSLEWREWADKVYAPKNE